MNRNQTPEEVAAKDDLIELINVGGLQKFLKELIGKEFLVVLLPPREIIDTLTVNSEATKKAVLFHFIEKEEFASALSYCEDAVVEMAFVTTKTGQDIAIRCRAPAEQLASNEIQLSDISMPGYTFDTPFGMLRVHRVPRVLQPMNQSQLRIDLAAWGFDATKTLEPIGIAYVPPNKKDESLKQLAGSEPALAVYAIGVLHAAMSAVARAAYSTVTSDYDKMMMRFQQDRLTTARLILPAGKAFLSTRLKELSAFVEENRGKLDGKNGKIIIDVVKPFLEGPQFTAQNIEPLLKKSNAFGALPGRIAKTELPKLMSSVFSNNNTDDWSKVLMYSLLGFIELRAVNFVNAENWFDKAINSAVAAPLS